MHRFLACSGAALLLLCAGACGDEPAPAPPPRSLDSLTGPHDTAVIEMEDLGTIRVELLPEIAPQTVALFSKLAQEGAYDGTTFHRVIPGFMIQGGDPETRGPDPRRHGRGGTGEFPDEFSDVSHQRGAVSLANKGRKKTANGQFFIVQADAPQLDGKYTIFGRVVDGMDVVDAITRLEIDVYGRYGPRNRPYPKDARIRSIRIEPAGADGAGP